MYETGKLRHSFDGPYTPAQREALQALAWSLPRDHAPAYFAHRWRLTQLLLGWDRQALPDGLVLMPGLHQYQDNPPVPTPSSALHRRVLEALQALIDTPLFAGWIYLAVCVGVVGACLWKLRAWPLRQLAGRPVQCAAWWLAVVVATSSLAYALPLALASGSAEFRYLAWPVLATLCATLLVLMPPVARLPRSGLA